MMIDYFKYMTGSGTLLLINGVNASRCRCGVNVQGGATNMEGTTTVDNPYLLYNNISRLV